MERGSLPLKHAIVDNGGQESACGWRKDRCGHSWQITSRLLLELTTGTDGGKAKRAFEAMMTMKKIDIATLEAAAAGSARANTGLGPQEKKKGRPQ